jgi:hypothetical protein
MKNLHVLPTDKKPIKGDLLLRHLWKGEPNECISWWRYNDTTMYGDTLVYTTLNGSFMDVPSSFKVQNIYITSDEEIKEGDYVYSTSQDCNIQKVSKGIVKSYQEVEHYKKIILTTDKELIKDGVQGINGVMANDFKFLNWFVNNPNCKEVEVKKYVLCDYCGQENCDNLRCRGYKNSLYYEIIIPQQEQNKKMYSEEDLKEAFKVNYRPFSATNVGDFDKDWNKWFEQFKKK